MTGFGLSQAQMLAAFIAFYIVLGMFMDTLSMMVATIPLSFPVAWRSASTSIWFGISS